MKSPDIPLESASWQADEDAGLVRQAKAGSRTAFDALFHRHKAFVYNVCYRTLGSADDAVDITQAAFVQAWRELRKFRGDAAFRSWLYRIAVNLCINLARREQRRRRLAEGMPEPHGAEKSGEVWDIVLDLPPEHRAVLALVYFQGMTCEEAAQAMGCSCGALRTRLHRARAAFKKRYEELER